MATKININKQEDSISYYDGHNVIKVDSQYYLIAQSDAGMMTLFELGDDMEWNRYFDPIKVEWHKLNVNTIKDYIPEFSGKAVSKVKVMITIQIND